MEMTKGSVGIVYVNILQILRWDSARNPTKIHINITL